MDIVRTFLNKISYTEDELWLRQKELYYLSAKPIFPLKDPNNWQRVYLVKNKLYNNTTYNTTPTNLDFYNLSKGMFCFCKGYKFFADCTCVEN